MHPEGLGRPPAAYQILRDTVNERTVRILLECILVGSVSILSVSVNISIDTMLKFDAKVNIDAQCERTFRRSEVARHL